MKNKILLLLCLVLSAMLVFTSCEEKSNISGGGNDNEGDTSEGGSNNNGCQHTFSDAWATDAKTHWHQATCEHGEIKNSLGDHTDANEDGFCEVCEYEVGHTHTYVDEWSSNLENHWKTATCSHKDRVGDLALHYDDDSDAECDACGAHVHVLTASGRCIGCGEQIKHVDTSNMPSLIQTLADHCDNVNGGKITTSYTGRYGTSSNSTSTAKVIEYMFGNGSAYFKEASAAEVVGENMNGTQYEANISDLVEKWRNREQNGSVYGVFRETVDGVAGDLYVDSSVRADTLYGYYFAVSTLADGYGAEGILKALYDRSQEDSASNFVYNHEEGTKTCKFSFESTLVNTASTTAGLVVNVNYFVVSVEFAYDNYTLTDLKITCDCYTSDGGSKLVKNEETGELENVLDEDNVDLDYDMATGTITFRERAKADTYVFIVEQTLGERTFVNEYTKEYFSPKSFDIYTNETFTTLAGDSINLAKGTTIVELFLKESGENGKDFSSVAEEEFIFTCVPSDGTTEAPKFYNQITSRIMFYGLKTGSYVITIIYGGVTKTINLTVG